VLLDRAQEGAAFGFSETPTKGPRGQRRITHKTRPENHAEKKEQKYRKEIH
jgi:hypothetical protein